MSAAQQDDRAPKLSNRDGCEVALSVVVPCFNEAGVVDRFYEAVLEAVACLVHSFELLFVRRQRNRRPTVTRPRALRKVSAAFPA